MAAFMDVLWIELLKVRRSVMPFYTALGALFMPAGVALLIFLAKNPELSHRFGLLGAKANLTAYFATTWSTYLALCGQIIAAGGFFIFVLSISWIFGREFVDGTLKDLLAVPVARTGIVLAKFAVLAIWSGVISLLILVFSLLLGLLISLPGASAAVFVQGGLADLAAAVMVILVVLPFALFASVGRGYLLPMGLAVFLLVMANLVAAAGWGEFFPWAVPALFAQGTQALPVWSFASVLLTALVGILGTCLWWKYADQNR